MSTYEMNDKQKAPMNGCPSVQNISPPASQSSNADTATIARPARTVSKTSFIQDIQGDLARGGITMPLDDVQILVSAIKDGKIRAFSPNY